MTWANFAHLILGILLGMAPAAIGRITKRYNGTDPVETAIIEETMRKLNRTENKDESK